MQQPELSIIIPTKDRDKILKRSLDSLIKAIGNRTIEVIVVNDSKTSVPVLEHNRFKLVNNPKAGVAAARNLGASLATAERLLFLDDDIIISEENLKRVDSYFKDYPNGIVNANSVYPPELVKEISKTKFGRFLIAYEFTSLKGWSRSGPWNDHEIFETSATIGQFLPVTKSIFNSVKGFDESFPFAGFEDYDFSKRLKAKGIRFYIDPTSIVLHNEEDRVSLGPWLERKRRGAVTRRTAVAAGYKELELGYGNVKDITYRLFSASKPALQAMFAMIPNKPAFDKLSFSLINLLLGTSIYEGYTTGKGK